MRRCLLPVSHNIALIQHVATVLPVKFRRQSPPFLAFFDNNCPIMPKINLTFVFLQSKLELQKSGSAFWQKKSYRKIFHLKYSVKKEFLKTFILSIDFFAAGWVRVRSYFLIGSFYFNLGKIDWSLRTFWALPFSCNCWFYIDKRKHLAHNDILLKKVWAYSIEAAVLGWIFRMKFFLYEFFSKISF